jgi:DNA-binding response OmpR family regulator
MSVAANTRSVRYHLDDAIRAWKRAEHRPGVLAVVDPGGVAAATARPLVRVGIQVDPYADPYAALVAFTDNPAQAVVMSARVPVGNTGDVVTRLRRDHGLTVLLALGEGDVEAATPAILAGAMPVLTLPLHPAQLLQHLDRVWVDQPRTPRAIALGGLELDEVRTGARLFGRPVDLTGAEFELLWRLIEHDGRAVRRQELWPLWPWADDQDGTLVAAVTRLRRKLAYHGFRGAIRTVRGIGYCLDLPASRDTAPEPRRDLAAVAAGA